MTIPDPISTLRTIIGLDNPTLALVPAARIFAGELPAAEVSLMPRKAVVISAAGGLADAGYVEVMHPRIDVRCYGATPLEASQVGWVVYDCLKDLQRRTAVAAQSGVRGLIHNVTPESGPTALRDADGKWPMTLWTFSVMASEVVAV